MHDEIDLDSVGDLSQETKDLVLALKGSPRLLAEETYFASSSRRPATPEELSEWLGDQSWKMHKRVRLSAAVEHQHAAI